MVDCKISPYELLVAKYSAEGNWLPYYAHLMDTAGIIERLVNHWLPAHIMEAMSEREPTIEWDKLCVFIALSHDIGKATPIFQSRICDQSSYLKERIIAAGIELRNNSEFIDSSKTPHSFAGEAILLHAGCPEGIAAVVGTHHGSPCSGIEDPEDMMSVYEENFYGSEGRTSTQGQQWSNIWKRWIDIALEYSGYEDLDSLPEIDVPTQMILSGLLMMADWIASNSEYAPLISQEDDSRTLEYPERIDQIWEQVSFPDQWMPSCWFMNDEIFKEKYGFFPNEMQRRMVNAVEEASTPGIYVLEAQMGLGKTEAALSAAEILASKWHCEGVFFGLPTQATANGIFPRMKSWIEKQSDGNLLSIKLAHGSAMLQKDYQELFHGYANQNEDEEHNGLIVHSWFEGRKQALLSSFVIGTVDQLLMAALQQKHVMLRHLGLAGKIVVIDECHAYDAYMNSYLERALEWLGIYEVPVILLSATLPSKRRVKLIEAYHGKTFEEEPEGWRNNTAYPLLTYTDGNSVKQCVIPVDSLSKKIKIIRAETDEIAKILKERLIEGGCAGVIVNTVAQAQEMARELREKMPTYTILLIHARFTMADRQQIEAEILRRLGKTSDSEDRRLIVVGTQILEQSLDIDFDLLITQLAPMDLLLQRIGRLHRHGHRDRPELLRDPVCVVCGCKELDEASRQIYGDWLLRRTKELLPDVICLPDDISPLVQETYRDMTEEEELYPFWTEQMEKQKIKERKAANHRILREKDLEETVHGLLDHNVGDRESDALARVRDGESSISVLLMIHKENEDVEFLPWQSQGERLSMNHVPSEEECRKILLQKVQLPRPLSVYRYDECVTQLEKQNREYLEEWQHSRWLQGELVLLLDENMTAELCGYTMSYNKQYGLMCEKEE
jgi:CRISPR-associated endonuclease/helicase Cas3